MGQRLPHDSSGPRCPCAASDRAFHRIRYCINHPRTYFERPKRSEREAEQSECVVSSCTAYRGLHLSSAIHSCPRYWRSSWRGVTMTNFSSASRRRMLFPVVVATVGVFASAVAAEAEPGGAVANRGDRGTVSSGTASRMVGPGDQATADSRGHQLQPVAPRLASTTSAGAEETVVRGAVILSTTSASPASRGNQSQVFPAGAVNFTAEASDNGRMFGWGAWLWLAPWMWGPRWVYPYYPYYPPRPHPGPSPGPQCNGGGVGGLVEDRCCPTGCAISGTNCPVDFPANSQLCCESGTRCESGTMCGPFECVIALPSG